MSKLQVSRMMLYSAANGATHAECIEWKLSNLAVEAEDIMKRLQAGLSQSVINAVLKVSAEPSARLFISHWLKGFSYVLSQRYSQSTFDTPPGSHRQKDFARWWNSEKFAHSSLPRHRRSLG